MYNAAASAAITHADPRCIASCVAIATIISRIFQGANISTQKDRELEIARAFCVASKHLDGGDIDELSKTMLSYQYGTDGLSELNLSQDIGYTYKPVAVACFVFVLARDYKEAITMITMEGGDADTNAVVAGALHPLFLLLW